MGLNEAQQRHIQAALDAEQKRMEEHRPLAYTAVLDLIEAMKEEQAWPDNGDEWPDKILILWSTARTHTELAVSGQADGWFTHAYPLPCEMIEALLP